MRDSFLLSLFDLPLYVILFIYETCLLIRQAVSFSFHITAIKHLITCSISIFMTPEKLYFYHPDPSVNTLTPHFDRLCPFPSSDAKLTRKRINTDNFANLLLLKWIVLHLSMAFSLTDHVCQFAFPRVGGKKEGRRGKKESLVPADAHCPLRRDERASRFKESRSPLFCFHLIFSPHSCGRYKSLEL